MSINPVSSPKVYRLFDLREKRQRNLGAGARRLVGGIDHFQHGAAVRGRNQRLGVLTNALHEVPQLLRIALIECLLVHTESPAFGRSGLLGRISVAVEAVSERGV